MHRTTCLSTGHTCSHAGERVRLARWRLRLAIANLFLFGHGKIT